MPSTAQYYVVLGIVIVSCDIALWLGVAVTQWKRRDLEPSGDVTVEKPQNRPTWLDSTGWIVVLFVAAGMWATTRWQPLQRART